MDGEVVKKTPPRRTRWREGAAWRRDRAETAAKSLKQPQHQNMRVAARATRRALLGRAPPARLCNGAASDERAALLRRIRSLPPGEREQLLASVAELPDAAGNQIVAERERVVDHVQVEASCHSCEKSGRSDRRPAAASEVRESEVVAELGDALSALRECG